MAARGDLDFEIVFAVVKQSVRVTPRRLACAVTNSNDASRVVGDVAVAV